MKLTLRIENLDYLPDGGPLEFTAIGRSFEVGRDSAMDWTLPDPSRHVSSRHFEVVYRDGGFWLNDVSTNGTFIYGAAMRVASPLHLSHDDRLQVGQYIIRVTIEPSAATAQEPVSAAPAPPASDPWSLTPAPMPPLGRAPTAPPAFAPPSPATPPPAPASEPFTLRAATTPPATAPAEALPLLDAICKGAGLPPGSLAQVDVGQLGEAIGKSLRIATEELMALLGARAAAKKFVKSSSRTMIGGMNNSPLKFKPNAAEALLTMFAQKSESYLSATAAFQQGFDDIKRHQTAVYAAMQPALARLLEDLAPEAIEERSSGGLMSSKKARAWELFVERWDAKTHPYENGMLDVFLAYFSDAYDEAVKKTGG